MYEAQLDTKYRRFWDKYLKEELPYNAYFENYPHQYSVNEDYYVYFGFFAPKKNEYVITRSTDDGQKFYLNTTVTEARQEDIVIRHKEYSRNIIQRVFDKENSVFASWKIDNLKEIEAGLAKDIMRWKVSRFVKDETDYNNV